MDYIRINIFVPVPLDSSSFETHISGNVISKVVIDYPFDSDLQVRYNSVEEYTDIKYVLINKSETQVFSLNLHQADGSLYSGGSGVNGNIPGLKGTFTMTNPLVNQSGRVIISTDKKFINLPYQDCIINIINSES